MPKVGQDYEFTTEQLRNFQDLFIHAREDLGKSQSTVAEETGLKQTWISSVERATYPSFNMLDMFRLAQYYGITPNQIAHVLGFMDGGLDVAVEEHGSLVQLQRLFRTMSPEYQHLALVLVRQLLSGMADFEEKKEK